MCPLPVLTCDQFSILSFCSTQDSVRTSLSTSDLGEGASSCSIACPWRSALVGSGSGPGQLN